MRLCHLHRLRHRQVQLLLLCMMYIHLVIYVLVLHNVTAPTTASRAGEYRKDCGANKDGTADNVGACTKCTTKSASTTVYSVGLGRDGWMDG